MYTPIKTLLIKYRERAGDNMTQMAKKLGCSFEFISLVQSRRNKPPESWIEKLTKKYNLNQREQRELKKTIYFERNINKIDISNLKEGDKLLLLEISYSFKKYKSKIKQIINKKEK